MAPQPRVHVVDRRWITPSRSTPPRNRRTQLSDWDIVMFKSYTPILLFYPNDKKDPDFMNSRVLKLALADVLIDFYPLAGRLVDVGNGRDEINNCDSGVLFQVESHSVASVKYQHIDGCLVIGSGIPRRSSSI